MSEVTKRKELTENSLVEIELDGNTVIGWLVRLEGDNAIVRYGSDRLITLLYWKVKMVETVVIIPIWGRTSDDDELVWDDSEDYYSYFGTRVDCCFWLE